MKKSGYAVEQIKAGERLGARATQLLGAKKNLVVLVDTSFLQKFPPVEVGLNVSSSDQITVLFFCWPVHCQKSFHKSFPQL
jgi:hypothetical protein